MNDRSPEWMRKRRQRMPDEAQLPSKSDRPRRTDDEVHRVRQRVSRRAHSLSDAINWILWITSWVCFAVGSISLSNDPRLVNAIVLVISALMIGACLIHGSLLRIEERLSDEVPDGD